MADIIQIRRDTSANFTDANVILAQGEPALEIDTLKEKIGDGVTAWVDLGYRINPDVSLREFKIDGYWVDKKGNIDKTTIEVGDQIRGNFSASRYIIADVIALPHTVETNLEFYLDAEK